MDIFESEKRSLAAAGRFAQIALAAECAERIYPIYQAYWVGSYYESVKQSIELAWSYAMGNQIDEDQLQANLEELGDLVNYYYEEGISELAETVNSVFLLLQAVSGNEEETIVAVAQCLGAIQAAALYTEAMVNQRMPVKSDEEVAAAYEEAWQESALKIIDGWSDYASKEMFAPIREEDLPPWLKKCFDRYKPSKAG